MENLLYIVWDDKYNTGILLIDEQHRSIVASINSLHYFNKKRRGEDVLPSTLSFLEQYIDIHFRTEEDFMSEANYPTLEEHILLHDELSKKTKKVLKDLTTSSDVYLLLNHLKEWWLNHINKEDREYAPYLLTAVNNN